MNLDEILVFEDRNELFLKDYCAHLLKNQTYEGIETIYKNINRNNIYMAHTLERTLIIKQEQQIYLPEELNYHTAKLKVV